MALRMLEMVVAESTLDRLDQLPENLPILGQWKNSLHDDLVMVRLLCHTENTEEILKELEEKFQTNPFFRVFIQDINATLPKIEREPVIDVPPSTEAPTTTKPKVSRIAIDEMMQDIDSTSTLNRVFLLTVILSTIVAAIGLISNNVAVIIGAMVIAPLLTPNMALVLGTTLGDTKLLRKALVMNIAGVGLALALSVAIGMTLSFDPGVPEIQNRLKINTSDLILALAAGSAGSLSFTAGVSAALVGVMVAVALLPPLVTGGLLMGAGQYYLAQGAFFLVIANIICVNISGILTFIWQGVRPRNFWEEAKAKRTIKVVILVWIILLALLYVVINLHSQLHPKPILLP